MRAGVGVWQWTLIWSGTRGFWDFEGWARRLCETFKDRISLSSQGRGQVADVDKTQIAASGASRATADVPADGTFLRKEAGFYHRLGET